MKSESNTYRYIAKDSESYRKLAREMMRDENLQLTLYPGLLTIVACPFCSSTKLDEALIETIGKYIDDNALNFNIEPVECDIEDALGNSKPLDPSTLINLICGIEEEKEGLMGEIRDLKEEVKRLKSAGEDRDQYMKKMRERLSAVKTMIETIHLY